LEKCGYNDFMQELEQIILPQLEDANSRVMTEPLRLDYDRIINSLSRFFRENRTPRGYTALPEFETSEEKEEFLSTCDEYVDSINSVIQNSNEQELKKLLPQNFIDK
jgi:hypothetical protein